MLEKDLIAKFSIFDDMPQEHIAEIGRCTEILEFKSGDTILWEGEKATNLYGVIEGEVELSLTVRDKILKTDIQHEEYVRTHVETIERDIILDTIIPGDIFGWSALTSSQLYTSTAKCCATPSTIFAMEAEDLMAFFRKHPTIGYLFMERLVELISQRLRNRTDKLIEGWSQAFDVDRI